MRATPSRTSSWTASSQGAVTSVHVHQRDRRTTRSPRRSASITYTITASAGAGGSITPSGSVSVGCGANQSFTIAGDACHNIADVLVDGVSSGPVASYTFTNVTANHTIAASFVHVAAVVPAPTAVSATQVLLGNPAGQRTGIVIHFGSVVGAASYKVYRAPYGQYPEYDDNGGAAPIAADDVAAGRAVDAHGRDRDRWHRYAADARLLVLRRVRGERLRRRLAGLDHDGRHARLPPGRRVRRRRRRARATTWSTRRTSRCSARTTASTWRRTIRTTTSTSDRRRTNYVDGRPLTDNQRELRGPGHVRHQLRRR